MPVRDGDRDRSRRQFPRLRLRYPAQSMMLGAKGRSFPHRLAAEIEAALVAKIVAAATIADLLPPCRLSNLGPPSSAAAAVIRMLFEAHARRLSDNAVFRGELYT